MLLYIIVYENMETPTTCRYERNNLIVYKYSKIEHNSYKKKKKN